PRPTPQTPAPTARAPSDAGPAPGTAARQDRAGPLASARPASHVQPSGSGGVARRGQPDAMRRRTDARAGMPLVLSGRSTLQAPTAVASVTASSGGAPNARAASRPATVQSPAPVVPATSTAKH